MPDAPSPNSLLETAARLEITAPVLDLAITLLEPDPVQPRSNMKPETLRELAASIQEHGILQPLLIRPKRGPGSAGRFWIVAGERRYRAAQLLGLTTLPCRVREYAHEEAAVVALAENVHREELTEIDKAEALQRIKQLTDRTWEDVAEMVKLSRDYVKRLAGLLRLEEAVKELVRSGEISARTAIAIRPLPPQKQVEMAHRVLAEGLTAEQVRLEVQSQKAASRMRKPPFTEKEILVQVEDTPAGRGPAVAGILRNYAGNIQEMERWLDSKTWTGGRVGPAQFQAFQEFADEVTLLQQRVRSILAGLERVTDDDG